MKGLMSRSSKRLSTFEFKRQNIAGYCKQTFHFMFNINLIQRRSKAKYDFFSFMRDVEDKDLRFDIKFAVLWNWFLETLLIWVTFTDSLTQNTFNGISTKITNEPATTTILSYISSIQSTTNSGTECFKIIGRGWGDW